MASDLKVGPVPLIKGKETQHILVMGTVGSGKTQTIFGLLVSACKIDPLAG